MKKKSLAIVSAIVMTASLLAGCGASGSADKAASTAATQAAADSRFFGSASSCTGSGREVYGHESGLHCYSKRRWFR